MDFHNVNNFEEISRNTQELAQAARHCNETLFPEFLNQPLGANRVEPGYKKGGRPLAGC
ncbi:hypothetical protein J2S08_003249 [Bacillus chungangensis]|uniref:Uncharacterized protein n=1 Tax=Bacillus chungangensis TaxID=587633 RepID=A0ABT9WVN5_9BACI|nr:hypothetical protein [Bacillus chungangensis]